MKSFTKVLGISAGVLMIGMMASCSTDVEPNSPVAPVSKSVLVRTPEIKAWSGEENFGPTRSTRAVEATAPAAVSPNEIAAAKAYFNAKDNWLPANGGADVEIEDLANVTTYYVQAVAEGNEIPADVAQYVGTNREKVSNIAVWNIDADEVIKILKTDDYVNNPAKVEVDPAVDQLVVNHPVKDFSFETTGYDINMTLYENIRVAGHTGQYDFTPNYKIATLDGEEGFYVALYGYTNQNNGYWDRIIKIVPTEVAPEPETPEVGEGEGEGEEVKVLHNNEVEVNLSVLDTHNDYTVEDLMTKLSIHVRYAKDVTVRIPVPYEILVPADDLDIVVKHPNLLAEGAESHASFEIDGNIVDLFVKFVEANDCAGNGYGYFIEVSTKGINKDVIAYCMENYEDGVNFEVYNYFTWNTTDENGEVVRNKPTAEQIAELQNKWLNKSTIEFGYYSGENWNAYVNMADYPYYYINAFGSRDGSVTPGDCVVSINGNQSYAFSNSFVGVHLNSTANNVIFVRDDIFGTSRQDVVHTEGFGLE